MRTEMTENTSVAAMNWLLEMEIANNPLVLNMIVLNLLKLSDRIKDVQFVVDVNARKILVYLEISRWAKWLKMESTLEKDAMLLLDQALPSFKKRVVFDRNILDMAVQIIKNQGAADGKTCY